MSKRAESSGFSRKWNFQYDTSDGGGQGGVFRVLPEEHRYQYNAVPAPAQMVPCVIASFSSFFMALDLALVFWK